MQGPSWIELFRRVPPKWHDCLAISLVTGAEIMMHSLLRLETEFAVVRGRMAGSTDAGRVIILPYDQIVNLAFTKRMLQNEVADVFGELLTSAEAPAEVPEDADDADEAAAEGEGQTQGFTQTLRTASVAAATKPAAVTQPAAAAGEKKPAAPSKSMLLARLRQRLAEKTK